MRAFPILLALACTSDEKITIPQDSGIQEVITDLDGDGYLSDEDCDDSDVLINPSAEEICDGLDNNCDGIVLPTETDTDGDGYRICNGDCDDENANAYPGQVEICDGADNDCDGYFSPEEHDSDLDGQRGCEGDCDDSNQAIYSGHGEVCDGKDNDCNGQVDNGLSAPDASKIKGVCVGQKKVCKGISGWQDPDFMTITGYES